MKLDSYFARKHGSKTSRAHMQLFIELQRRRLTRGAVIEHGVKFNREKDGVAGTWIDIAWHYQQYAVMLDGNPIHHRLRQGLKDDLVDLCLQQRGWHVDRFEYDPPITKKAMRRIADEIEKKLKKLGYQHETQK